MGPSPGRIRLENRFPIGATANRSTVRGGAGFRRSADPTGLTVAQALTGLIPLSRTMAEVITALGQWARRGDTKRTPFF
jgi:hypothetical protein